MEVRPTETPHPGRPKGAAPWSAETRRWVVIGLILAGVWLLYQLSDILPPILVALFLAYLLNPLVGFLHERQRVPRLLAVASIYLVLVAVLIIASILLTPALIRQVRALSHELDSIITATMQTGQVPLADFLGIQLDPTSLTSQLRTELVGLASALPGLLIGAASGVLNGVLALVLSLYLLIEADAVVRSVDQLVPVEYRDEWQRIKTELDRIWSSFLRGQVTLALIIGVLVTLALVILGVPNALLLGLLAGVLEVIPNIGPVIAMIPAVLVALFQGSMNWRVDNVIFALIVLLTYFVIQQLENHLIVPKVLGGSVNLPPLVILIGAFAGANLAGVLGIFLAAPVLATARLAGEFVLKKLLEPQPALASQGDQAESRHRKAVER
jgi:predicted PurR-regulated permease PerM